MTAALKEQFPRHCFIKVQNEETQPLLVPKVEDPYTTEENLLWYRNYQLQQIKALSALAVDQLLQQQETQLLARLEAPAAVIDIDVPPPAIAEPELQPPLEQESKPKTRKAAAPEKAERNIFDELVGNG